MNQQKGFANIVLIVLVVVLVGVVGYFVLVKKSPEAVQQTNTPTPTTQTPTTKSPTPSLDETTNWKTYRSDQYGFEFKYPNDWSIEVSQIYPFSIMVFPKGFEKDKRDMAFTINPVNVGRESVFDAGANVNIQSTVVGGKKAKIYSCPEQNQCPTQLSFSKSIKVTELPKNWTNDNEIDYSLRKGYENLRSTFESVLSSLKF